MRLSILTTVAFTAPFWLATLVKAEQPFLTQLSPTLKPPVLIAQSTWQEFTSSDGGFSVSMPGTPKHETETDKDGSVSHSYTLDLKETVYLVTYYDVPQAEKASPEQVKQLLDVMPVAFAQGADSKLVRSQDISLNGNPGKEFEFASNGGISGKGRIYLVKQRLFLVVSVNPQTQNIQQFLESFRLL